MDSFGLRILVVDDDRASREMLSTLIKQSGHDDAIAACDGRDGLARAMELQPDVVIAQRLLPAMSGIDLARQIREAPDQHQPYIILISWPEDEDELMAALEAGIDQFIDPPFRMGLLSTQLRAGQRIARLQRENERCQLELQQCSRELASSKLRVRELAITDELTGLPNRRHAMELMQHEWITAERDDQPLSCMAIDLDGLKLINDEQGHERGDVVLKTVAAIMRKYLPPGDLVCRSSGDEFLVICPGATLEATAACGEKLVGLIGSFNIHAEGHTLGLSIGVAERRPGVHGPHELINLAEQAMHRAKHAGKNRMISGHGAELHPARGSKQPGRAAAGSRKKGRKQFPLWGHADVLDLIAAGT